MLIGGRRVCGKTTELIKKANKEWLYIVCADRQRLQHILDTAKRLKLDIPFPIIADELPLRSHHVKAVLVDDIEDVLYQIIRKPIIMASTSMEIKEIKNGIEKVKSLPPKGPEPRVAKWWQF